MTTNAVTSFLRNRWSSLQLAEIGDPDALSCVFVTPRFRTSSHLLIFVLCEGRASPVLVAKLPRLAGDNLQLDREAGNLRSAQALRDGGFDSIPRVVAYEEIAGHRLLIESAVDGKPLRPASIRRNLNRSIESSLGWLTEFHEVSTSSSCDHLDWQTRLVDEPLAILDAVFPADSAEHRMVDATRSRVEALRSARFPLVFEHGDFCAPNILRDRNGRIGIVDWELAQTTGLPAADAFLFLNSAAFSRRRARSNRQYLAAFREAFYGPGAWTREYLERYCARLGLECSLLNPLFVITWSRYVANLVRRLRPDSEAHARLRSETVNWLRGNRYYQLWKYALESKDAILGL